MLKKRKLLLKILYYLFISTMGLALSVLCVGIVFYTAGYQVNWKTGKIQKTGMLVITIQENNFKLLIDNKEVKVEASRGINLFTQVYKKTMLPGDYDLEIKKDGKKSYTQKIKIEPELITKVEDVLLLPEAIPEEKILEKDISQYLISPDGKIFCYQTPDSRIFFFDVIKKEEREFDQEIKGTNVELYKWDSDSKKILIKLLTNNRAENYYLINSESFNESYLLSSKLSFFPMVDEIYFSPKKDGELFVKEKNNLYRVNIPQNNTEKIETGISHLVANKDSFYYLFENDNLIHLDANNYGKEIVLENFLLKDDFELITISGNNIFFINDKSLYYIKDKNNLELIDKDAEDILAEINNQGFFYTNGFEIWHYDGSKKEKTILTRFSREIKNIQEVYENEYLIYQQGTDINVTKKDGVFTQVINNNIENIKVFNKNKILVVEKSENEISLRIIDLNPKN